MKRLRRWRIPPRSDWISASGHAFRLYSSRKFRRLVNSKQQNQVEQDRIFNELVVAFVVMTILLLEAPDLRVPDEFKEYLALLHGRIPKAHIDCLRNLGVQDEYLDDWEKLIDLRYQEYAKDRHDVRVAAMELKAADDELELKDLQKFRCWCRYSPPQSGATTTCARMKP